MDIKQELLDYLNCKETTGALLLTGPWGCGKSFLVKQIVKELNESKKFAIAVVSLFGIDSIYGLNHRIREDYLSVNKPFVAKAKQLFKPIGNMAKDGLNVASIINPTLVGLSAASQGVSAVLSYDFLDEFKVKNTAGKNTQFALVFDDLERSNIPPKDLLGTMNEYVENRKIKVIVIADEEKIKGEEYKEYKEKLISRTLCMAADYDYLIESIVENYVETSNGYRDFLIQNQDLLKQAFFESKTFNIRTLKCILADFERVYKAWTETDVPTDNMKWALYTFGAEVFVSKTPKKEKETAKESKTLFYSNEEEKQYSNKGKNSSYFSSLNKWIYHGIWNCEEFTDELKQKYTGKNETPLYRFLTYRFWDLQQKDIDEGLPKAVSLAYNGELSKDQLIHLISCLHILKENGFSLPTYIDYSKIEVGFDKRFEEIKKGNISEPQSHTFIEKSNVDEAALPLLMKLERFDDRIIANENRMKFLAFLTGDSEISYYSLKGFYVEEFDDEWFDLFTQKYSIVNNSEKNELAMYLLGMNYDCDSYSTEENIKHSKENFEKLADLLEKMETCDSITKILNKVFIEKIREKSWNQ